MHHICIIIGIISYKVPGISSIERFIAKKAFGQKTCVFVLPLLDLEEQEIFTSRSAACSPPRSSPIPTQQLPYWALVGICGKDSVLSSVRSCGCITGTWTRYECENSGDCAAPSCAAARRPWVRTWKGWLMPGLRCLQLSPLPHPSILIVRCSPPPPYCASEASS